MNKRIKRVLLITLSLTFIIGIFVGCSAKSTEKETTTNAKAVDATELSLTSDFSEIDNEDMLQDIDLSNATTIKLSDTSATINGDGATNNKADITISSGGTYSFSGTTSDGSILVDVTNDETVIIVLNGVSITNKDGAVISVENAKKTILNANNDTKNTLIDASNYEDDSDDSPDSTVYSKDDLTINGGGKINITANYNDAIKSNDTLIITGSTLNINSVDDGIIGKDYVIISDGAFTLNCDGDGIKSTYDTDTTKGEVKICGGTYNLTVNADGMQANTRVFITGGTFDIETNGGSTNAERKSDNMMFGGQKSQDSSDTEESSGSYKGIKSSTLIEITGGKINLNTADDSIHSGNTVTISGGNIKIAAGDDAVHSDSVLNLKDGTIEITSSYEGLEGAEINISGGTTHLVASDDGINAAGGDSSQSSAPNGGDNFSSSTGTVKITGGYLYMNANGDGLDSNGSISMSDGTIIIDGPTNGGNGALDYDSEFKMTGGLLIASGSTGMAQSISDSSSVYAVSIGTSGDSGSVITISDSPNKEVISFAPSKSFGNIVIATTDFEKGQTYSVSSSTLSSGDNKDGIITNGQYKNTTSVGTFKTSSILSTVGTAGGQSGRNPMDKGKK